jgi:hypothetical protein
LNSIQIIFLCSLQDERPHGRSGSGVVKGATHEHLTSSINYYRAVIICHIVWRAKLKIKKIKKYKKKQKAKSKKQKAKSKKQKAKSKKQKAKSKKQKKIKYYLKI